MAFAKRRGGVRRLARAAGPVLRRRGTLAADADERHLGLEDTDLMLRTVQAEFNRKSMFKA